MAVIGKRHVCGLLALLLCGACAGPDAARELSRETLAQVVEYEDSLRAMSRNLATYYKGNINIVKKSVESFEQTGIGRIRYQLAADAVDMVLIQGFRERQFRDYITSVNEAKRAEQDRFSSLLSKAVANQRKALAAVKVEEKKLKTVRVKLEALQTEPSTKDKIAQLKPYFEIARSFFNKIKP